MPATGKLGWEVFSQQVPVDGNIVLLFAPHIGIDKDGVVGKVTRKDHELPEKACNAAVSAFLDLKGQENCKKSTNFIINNQMDRLKDALKPHLESFED